MQRCLAIVITRSLWKLILHPNAFKILLDSRRLSSFRYDFWVWDYLIVLVTFWNLLLVPVCLIFDIQQRQVAFFALNRRLKIRQWCKFFILLYMRKPYFDTSEKLKVFVSRLYFGCWANQIFCNFNLPFLNLFLWCDRVCNHIDALHEELCKLIIDNFAAQKVTLCELRIVNT